MGSRIIVAADRLSFGACVDLAQSLGNRVHAFKVHDLVDAEGHRLIGKLRSLGVRNVWIDYKLHDIPDTVAARAKALVTSGASILTVHASGGIKMMKAALDAAPETEIFAVTVLTSLDDSDCKQLYGRFRNDVVLDFAELAVKAGVHGVVCSPNEVELLRGELGSGVRLVVPGVRSPGKSANDQKNVQTPAKAIADGADLLVVGRQITEADDAVRALEQIEAEIREMA